MSDEFSFFQTGTGLPLDGASVTVKDQTFGYNAEYSPDVLVATITFQPDEGDEITQLFSCGKGFEAVDRGKKAAHKSGKNIPFNNQTGYGRLIDSFVALGDEAMSEARSRGLEPNDAAWAIGMRFVMKTVKVTTKNPSTGVEKEASVFVFGEYLGTSEDEAPKKSSGSAKKLASKPSSKAAAKDDDDEFSIDGLDQEITDALVALAKDEDVEDHESFVDKAMEIDGVEGNRAAQKAIMNTKAGGVWATFGR